ncbi:MAG TPA: DNA gyrase C-terminal beta-propeller domain-containing protein, partial [Flavobacteriales bacterium]|nr:DNA gyrase C-terminal beta-propeller domain-containing protein [Flavobacteriales bacterium]
GYGKRSAIMDENGEYEYRLVSRGSKGVKTIQVTEKTGALVAIKAVKEGDQLMIINRSGITIRMGLDELRVLGRATQGVRLIELRGNDQIAAVARVDSDLNEEEGTAAVNPASEGTDPTAEAPEDEDGTDVDNA